MKGKYYLPDLTRLGVTGGFCEKTKMTYLTSAPTAEITQCSRTKVKGFSEKLELMWKLHTSTPHSHTRMKCFVCEHASTMSLPNGELCDLFSKISAWSGKGQNKDNGNQSRLHAVRQYVMWHLACSWPWLHNV